MFKSVCIFFMVAMGLMAHAGTITCTNQNSGDTERVFNLTGKFNSPKNAGYQTTKGSFVLELLEGSVVIDKMEIKKATITIQSVAGNFYFLGISISDNSQLKELKVSSDPSELIDSNGIVINGQIGMISTNLTATKDFGVTSNHTKKAYTAICKVKI